MGDDQRLSLLQGAFVIANGHEYASCQTLSGKVASLNWLTCDLESASLFFKRTTIMLLLTRTARFGNEHSIPTRCLLPYPFS